LKKNSNTWEANINISTKEGFIGITQVENDQKFYKTLQKEIFWEPVFDQSFKKNIRNIRTRHDTLLGNFYSVSFELWSSCMFRKHIG